MRLSEKRSSVFAFIWCLVFAAAALGQTSRQTPRGAVTLFFGQLKSAQYEALYDQLPSEIKKVATRDQTVQSLKRLGAFITMERMEVGKVQEHGNLAVIDTTIYGRLVKPMKIQGEEISEGRVSVQQYLIKEGKEWRVITADDRTRAYFLRENPTFSRDFSLSSPRLAYKRNGEWQPLGQPPAVNPART